MENFRFTTKEKNKQKAGQRFYKNQSTKIQSQVDRQTVNQKGHK